MQPGLVGASAQRLRGGPSLGSGKESEEGLRFLRETTASLTCNHDESGTAPASNELWISVFLAPTGEGQKQHHPLQGSACVAHHLRGVAKRGWHRLPTEPRERQGAPRQSPRFCVGHCANRKVEVTQEHIGRHSGASLPTDACHRRLQCEAAPPQNPCPRTTGTVMAKAVKRTATPAEARGQWERKVEATQQENPEQVRLKPLEWGRKAEW